MRKPTKWTLRPANTQISLGIRLVWSESSLSTWRKVPIERTAKTLIRLGRCPGWSESLLGAQSFCLFCHEAAHLCSSRTKKRNWGYKTDVGYIFAASRHLEAAVNLLQLAPKNCYNLLRGHDDFIWHLAKRSPYFLREI